jgi:lysophospholipase L1-like esterase
MMDKSLAMRPTPAALAAVVSATAAAAGVWGWLRLARCMREGDRLADNAVPFERRGEPHAPRVLVVGDSTGVGTGAARPEDSIAGLLALAFPDVSIVNRAQNGAKTLDAITQLADEFSERYDLVLVHVGGNDVLRRTPLRALAPQVEVLMRLACRISPNVVVTTTPNIGLLPAFFPPISWWMSRRSRVLCSLFAQASKRHGAHYVDFFHSRAHPFYRESMRYFACDRLHPSTECYRYAFDKMMTGTPIAAVFKAPRAEVRAA